MNQFVLDLGDIRVEQSPQEKENEERNDEGSDGYYPMHISAE